MSKKGGARSGSGRKPLSADLLKKHVSKADKDRRREVAKNLEVGSTLSCPKDMGEAAKAKWRELMRLYRKMPSAVLNDLDKDALRQYCEAWAVYKAAEDTWNNRLHGEVATTNEETQKLIDSTLAKMNRQSAVMSSLAEQLLLTPVGRARMGINPAEPKKGSALDTFLRKIGGDGADPDPDEEVKKA
jgi:P27 family predicted phage terminase small subunit